MTDRFTFRRVHEVTGTFVLVVLAVLIAAAVWTSRSQRWFKSTDTLRIVLPKDGAAGIRQGSEVYFLGTRVGSVSDVIVDATGRMEAEVSIRRDFFRFIRTDSSAVVKRKFGVAGDSFFEITRGEGKRLPEKNASIVCNEQFQSALESAIEEVRRETLLVLKKSSTGLDTWTALGSALGETRQHLDQLTVRVEGLAAGISAGQGTVGQLFTETRLAEDAERLLSRADATLAELHGTVTNLNAVVQNIQAGTARLPEITDAMANEAKDLPGLVRQTQISMRELDRLVEALQKTWLVRKFVNRTNPPPSYPASALPLAGQSTNRPVRSPKGNIRN